MAKHNAIWKLGRYFILLLIVSGIREPVYKRQNKWLCQVRGHCQRGPQCRAEHCPESFISHLYKHDATLNSSYYTITHGSIQSHYQFASFFSVMDQDIVLQENVEGKKKPQNN